MGKLIHIVDRSVYSQEIINLFSTSREEQES